MHINLLRTFETPDQSYGVFLMDNESREQQLLFLDSFYKSFGIRAQLELTWFDWFYIRNPLGFCNNYILLDLANHHWIGGFGFAKKSYFANGNRVVGGHGVNGFVNPGYEGRGLYTKLIATGLEQEHYLERAAFSFPYNRNIASIKGHLKSGWQSAISLSFLEAIIDGQGQDDAGIVCSSDPRDLNKVDFERIEIFSELNFTRSHSEMSWRYAERPDKQYKYLTMTSSENMGYMILGHYVTEKGSERCEIADYRYSSPEVLHRFIKKAKFVAAEGKYKFLDVLINPDSPCHAFFHNHGFTKRGDGYELLTYCMKPLALPKDIAVSYGDFDVV